MTNLRDETLDLIKMLEKKTDKNTKPILQAYKRALTETREEIAKLYVKFAVDGKLQMSKQQRYTYLKQLEKQLAEQAKKLGNIDLEHTTKILKDIYKESYYTTAFLIDKGIETTLDFALLNPKMVEAAVNVPIEGKMFSDRIWKNKELLVNRVRQSVERGIIQGQSVDKLARDIKNNFGSSAYESQRLVRTEVGRVMGEAQKNIYESSNVIKKIMWDATLDSKTRPEHAELDSKTWDIDDPNRKYAPDGVNCRCATIPIIDGWSPTKKRENQGEKPIIDYTSYETWAKSKGIN